MKLTSVVLLVGVIGGAVGLYKEFSGANSRIAERDELCAKQALADQLSFRRDVICASTNAQKGSYMRIPPRG